MLNYIQPLTLVLVFGLKESLWRKGFESDDAVMTGVQEFFLLEMQKLKIKGLLNYTAQLHNI